MEAFQEGGECVGEKLPLEVTLQTLYINKTVHNTLQEREIPQKG